MIDYNEYILRKRIEMKICIISKYPPIEGGVSSRTYWTARALGQKGHEVHVITNANEVEKEYREELDHEDPEYSPKNVFIHDISSPDIPWHIPYSKSYSGRLASKAIEVIEENDLELIYSYYLMPYGYSGYMAKTFTEKPQIMQHAGSDISRIFNDPGFNKLLIETLKKTDRIITYKDAKDFLLTYGIPKSNLTTAPKVSVDLEFFNPTVKPFDLTKLTDQDIEDIPIITFIGKIPYHWQSKGIGDLVKALKGIKKDFRLLLIANGTGLEEFKELIKKYNLEDKTIIKGFLPPWNIPSIIKRSTCVVVPEREFQVKGHTSNIPLETKAEGRNLIISKELYQNKEYDGLISNEGTQVIDPKDTNQFRKAIKKAINDLDKDDIHEGYKLLKKHDRFTESIMSLENLFEEICSK